MNAGTMHEYSMNMGIMYYYSKNMEIVSTQYKYRNTVRIQYEYEEHTSPQFEYGNDISIESSTHNEILFQRHSSHMQFITTCENGWITPIFIHCILIHFGDILPICHLSQRVKTEYYTHIHILHIDIFSRCIFSPYSHRSHITHSSHVQLHYIHIHTLHILPMYILPIFTSFSYYTSSHMQLVSMAEAFMNISSYSPHVHASHIQIVLILHILPYAASVCGRSIHAYQQPQEKVWSVWP